MIKYIQLSLGCMLFFTGFTFSQEGRTPGDSTNKFSKNAATPLTVASGSFYMPDVFTPNNDNLNDVFYPVAEEVREYSLYIYNRKGELVFESNVQEKGWDGNFNNSFCKEGMYVYKVDYTDNADNTPHTKVGKVMLIR